MSLYDYRSSKRISDDDPPFYALIIAAMRQADSDNLLKLRRAFPEVEAELVARYNAPGGLLPGEARDAWGHRLPHRDRRRSLGARHPRLRTRRPRTDTLRGRAGEGARPRRDHSDGAARRWLVMSDVETLRQAASLMRERADHPEVSAETWFASPHGDVHDNGSLWVCDSQSGPTAEHIASWHPTVALAVADALETASEYDRWNEFYRSCMAIARAYLAGEAR